VGSLRSCAVFRIKRPHLKAFEAWNRGCLGAFAKEFLTTLREFNPTRITAPLATPRAVQGVRTDGRCHL
jgi:pectin methylesterase-like acyl-CoA thioesterase